MPKITLISQDLIGPKMAGPGIRYLELARALSRTQEVTLLAPLGSVLTPGPYQFVIYSKTDLLTKIPLCDVILTQEISSILAFHAHKNEIRLIYDAYDPLPLEYLEIFKERSLSLRDFKNRQVLRSVLFSLKTSDGVICACSKQRDLWMGALMALQRLTPLAYDQDPSYQRTLAIVPFGLPSDCPKQSGPGFRAKWGFGKDDPLLIWGGGIWNWFDPLTLINAMALIVEKQPKARLVFMGLKHPNEEIPEMQMAVKAMKLAKELNLFEKNVFFNFDWVPYQERQNYLLEADIGVSTHFEHLETQYSFRTRILDYLWTGLPMIVTKGDFFAELVEEHQLGSTVPAQDPHAIVEAFFAITSSKEALQNTKERVLHLSQTFLWNKQVESLERMIPFLRQPSQKKRAFSVYYGIVIQYLRNDFARQVYHRLKAIFPLSWLNQLKRGLGYDA